MYVKYTKSNEVLNLILSITKKSKILLLISKLFKMYYSLRNI